MVCWQLQPVVIAAGQAEPVPMTSQVPAVAQQGVAALHIWPCSWHELPLPASLPLPLPLPLAPHTPALLPAIRMHV